MKKRIAFSIALLMILCLALAGCAQRDNHAGATSNEPASESHDSGIGNPDNSESGELDSDVEPIGDDTNEEYFTGMTADGEYKYNINGVELSIQTKIDDYIDGNYFYLTNLAYDLGWHVREPNDPEDPNVMRFWNDSEEYHVGFGSNKTHDGKHYYDWVSYNSINVGFDRLDIQDDSIASFYVNKGGIPPYTVNKAQILILAYLFENADTVKDPLDGLVGAGSETHYHIYQ